MREEIKQEATAIKAQFAKEFERRFGHINQSEDYFKKVCDFTLEKMCLTAAKTRLLELELETIKRNLGQ